MSPARRVTFTVTGLPRGAEVYGVFVQPTRHRGANGYGWLLDQHHRAGRDGRVRLRFTWPRSYYVCGGHHHCHRQRWDDGQRADVYLQAGGLYHARRVVTVLLTKWV